MDKEKMNIDNFLNTFLNNFYDSKKILFDNINIFHELSIFLKSQTDFEIPKKLFNWHQISKSTFYRNVELIDNFFKKKNIDFNIDEVLKDGTIELIPTNYERVMYGQNNYLGTHKSITVYNNGYITDTIVWIHEISHYRNQTDEGRAEINDLLTESLAHTASLIFTDYLEEEGFAYEANISREDTLITFKIVASDTYYLTKILLLYESLGDTSRESYKYYYGTDEDYDNVINKFCLIANTNPVRIFGMLWYTLSGVLSIYMYNEYRKNNSFINNIERLNTHLLKETNLNECLSTIGITGYNKENLEKIEEAYDNYKKLLREPKYKTTKK